MFADVLSKVFGSFLKGKMALVYLALAARGHTPVVSYAELATATGYSKKTVIEVVKDLEACGLLIKLQWISITGENDKNCYIILAPNDRFNGTLTPNQRVYVLRAIRQLKNSRDGKPVMPAELQKMLDAVSPSPDATPPGVNCIPPVTPDETPEISNSNTSGGGGENTTPPNVCSNIYKTITGCQQRSGSEGVKNTLPASNDVVVKPQDRKERSTFSQKGPWVRFVASNANAKVNRNEIAVNLNEYFGVNLRLVVANTTEEKVQLALEAAVEYAKRTAIRNLQGLLVKAVTQGWTVGQKVFIAVADKKQDNSATMKNNANKPDKYRDLYRLVPA